MDGYELFTQIMIYCWLMGLLFVSQIPAHTKLVYFTMTLALLTFMSVRRMFSYVVVFSVFGVSLLVALAYTADIVKLITLIGCLMGVATTGYYIPPQFVFLLAVIIVLTLYATLLTVFVATHTDPFMTGFFIGFMALFWYTCVRLRPPFN